MSGLAKYPIAEYIGRRFGNRVVLSEAVSPARNRARVWSVRCDCGSEANVSAYDLIAGRHLMCRSCADTLQGRQNSQMWRGYGAVSQTVFRTMRALAERRGIAWELTIQDIDNLYQKQAGLCALSGQPLQFHRGSGSRRRGNASLDRIDASRSYVADNIKLVTKQVNMAKSRLSIPDFIEMCRAVTERNSQ